MKHSKLPLHVVYVVALMIMFPPVAHAAWTSLGRVESIAVLKQYNLLRIQVSGMVSKGPAAASGDAACKVNTHIDIKLDGTGAGTEENRVMQNLVQMAALTYRETRFFVSEKLCSTAGTSSSVPIANAVQVKN